MTPDDIIERWQNPMFDAEHTAEKFRKMGYTRGQATQPICGDLVNIYLKTKDGIVEDIRHECMACTLTTAAADIMCETIFGKPVDTELDLIKLVGIPVGVNRRNCILCVLWALEKARGPQENHQHQS